MKYVFRGHVDRVGEILCWMRMSDQTDPSRADEEWCVPLARLPRVPEVGQGLTFTITSQRGTFALDNRRWTARQLARAKARAQRWIDLFGIHERRDEPETAAAVDPHAQHLESGERAPEIPS